MHVRIWGADDAPLLVMLHGWGDVSASWQFVVDALACEWRIVAPDWRGFGLSQANGDSYWFPDYIADLEALLDHFSPDQPVRLVAHSLGGNVASLYAGIRPERIERLVNLEGTGLPPHSAEEAPSRYVQWLDQLRSKAPGFRSYPDYSSFAARLHKDNPRLSTQRAAFLARHMGEEAIDGSIHLAADPHHRWTNPVLYRVEESLAIWRKVTAPVLLITGAHSFLFSRFFSPDSYEYRRRIECFTNIREVMLEHSGHNMHHDEPEAVAGLIEEFMPS
jgi:pimeloyl-ACP methyl ester carboxylesterase